MEAPLYFFKIFTEEASKGNPAACALFSQWPDSHVLLRIAYEAAFVVPLADKPSYPTPASFSVAVVAQQLQLKTQAVNLPHLTRAIATIT